MAGWCFLAPLPNSTSPDSFTILRPAYLSPPPRDGDPVAILAVAGLATLCLGAARRTSLRQRGVCVAQRRDVQHLKAWFGGKEMNVKDSLERSLEDALVQIQKLEENLAEERQDNDGLRNELAELQEMIAVLESTYEEVSEQVEDVRACIKEQLDDLTRAKEGLQAKVAEAERRNSDLLKCLGGITTSAPAAEKNDGPAMNAEGDGHAPRQSTADSSISLGQEVVWSGKKGIVRFIGQVRFAGGEWVGLELTNAMGMHDGKVMGVSYFKCPAGQGVFARPAQLER